MGDLGSLSLHDFTDRTFVGNLDVPELITARGTFSALQESDASDDGLLIWLAALCCPLESIPNLERHERVVWLRF